MFAKTSVLNMMMIKARNGYKLKNVFNTFISFTWSQCYTRTSASEDIAGLLLHKMEL